MGIYVLTPWPKVTPYSVIEHLPSRWNQAIIYTNIDLASMGSCGIHMKVISQTILQNQGWGQVKYL